MTAAGRPSAFDPGHSGEALSALLDGELDDREADEVRRHLAGCIECRREMARLADARRRLREMTPVPAPPELAERTRARIGWRRRVLVAAAVPTAVLAGLVLWAARPAREVTALPAMATAPPIRPAGASAATAASVSGPAPAEGAQPVPLASLPAGYVAPAALDGLDLAGLWRDGGALAAVYGQGPARLVVFEQAGHLVASPGQQWTVLGGRQGEAGTLGTEATFASQVGPDLVVTLVGPGQDLAEAAQSLSGLKVDPPWPYRARSLARSLVEELTGS